MPPVARRGSRARSKRSPTCRGWSGRRSVVPYRISQELGLEMRAGRRKYVPRFSSELELSEEVQSKANEIIETTAEKGLLSGKSPTGYAAAAIYAASLLCNEKKTQRGSPTSRRSPRSPSATGIKSRSKRWGSTPRPRAGTTAVRVFYRPVRVFHRSRFRPPPPATFRPARDPRFECGSTSSLNSKRTRAGGGGAAEKDYGILDHLDSFERRFEEHVSDDAVVGSVSPPSSSGARTTRTSRRPGCSRRSAARRAARFETSPRRGTTTGRLHRRRVRPADEPAQLDPRGRRGGRRTRRGGVHDAWNGWLGVQREVAIADRPVDVEIGLDGTPDLDFDIGTGTSRRRPARAPRLGPPTSARTRTSRAR